MMMSLVMLSKPTISRKEVFVAQIREKVYSDRKITVRELANETRIFVGLCYEILTNNLCIKRLAVKLISLLLSIDQKERRL